MLKITVTKKEVNEDIKYPCLMISEAGTIILAGRVYAITGKMFKITGKMFRIILSDSTGKLISGKHLEVYEPKYWKLFHGKITLEQ